MSERAAYAVGIDLGTTHCVLACAALDVGETPELHVLPIPQLSAPGLLREKALLPSCLYQPHEAELSAADLSLPWNDRPEALVGEIARHLGEKTPIRLIASAKSWLGQAGVDCRQAFLPVLAPPEVARLSPFQTTVHYLAHLRDAWNARHPNASLARQAVTITVPASFNPAARELTLAAAHEVGLTHAVLLEEPQAAMYDWIAGHGDWRDRVSVGDVILVVDVGGGTTDFSLIAVGEEDGRLALRRIAIGDHILLGGDNMDLALAYALQQKLQAEGRGLEPWQLQALSHRCRDAKEKLLAEAGPNEVTVVVPGRGARLIGDSLRMSLSCAEVDRLLLDGFFPELTIDCHPTAPARAGLTTLNLPYAQDARITAHLAAFLSRQADAASGSAVDGRTGFIRPSALLLNGGVFKADVFAKRLLAVLNGWLADVGAPSARLLDNADLDVAVARGAAYDAYLRQGHGVRIRAATAAAYYVGVEQATPAVPGAKPPLQALCIAPFGMEEGGFADFPPYEFGLVVGEPVCFRFFVSTTRRDDPLGSLLPAIVTQELEELGEIDMTLPAGEHRVGETVPVNLAAGYTTMGTLQLEAVAVKGAGRWQIALTVRR